MLLQPVFLARPAVVQAQVDSEKRRVTVRKVALLRGNRALFYYLTYLKEKYPMSIIKLSTFVLSLFVTVSAWADGTASIVFSDNISSSSLNFQEIGSDITGYYGRSGRSLPILVQSWPTELVINFGSNEYRLQKQVIDTNKGTRIISRGLMANDRVANFTADYVISKDTWRIRGVIGQAKFDLRTTKKQKSNGQYRSLSLAWDNVYDLAFETDFTQGLGSCIGEYRYHNKMKAQVNCVSDGSLVDFMFTDIDHMIAGLINVFVWGENE